MGLKTFRGRVKWLGNSPYVAEYICRFDQLCRFSARVPGSQSARRPSSLLWTRGPGCWRSGAVCASGMSCSTTMTVYARVLVTCPTNCRPYLIEDHCKDYEHKFWLEPYNLFFGHGCNWFNCEREARTNKQQKWIRVLLHLSESEIASRWLHRESNLMFTLSSDKD